MFEKIKSLFERKTKNKPNIILLIMDALRVDFLEKNLLFKDIINSATFFKEMIVYSPYTIASMHSIHTGLYGSLSGVDAYYKNLRFDAENCITLAEYLKLNGYYTIADTFREGLIPAKSWDEFSLHDEYDVDMLNYHKSILEKIRYKDQPFFACLHNGYIHSKLVKEVIKKFEDFDENYFKNRDNNKERYNKYVEIAGEYLKNLFDYMVSTNLVDNTMIIVMADHGSGIGEKKGEKAYGVYTYDYSIKTFGLFIFPELFPPGKKIRTQVRTVDVFPTIVDIIGSKPPKKYKPFSGESLMPVVREEETESRPAFVETGGIDGPFPSPYDPNIFTIRKYPWKLIYNNTTKEKELYNLKADPEEKNNLADEKSDILNKMWQELNSFKKIN